MPTAIRHVVMHGRVGIWKRVGIRKWPDVVRMAGSNGLSCPAGAQQPCLSTLKNRDLLGGRLFVCAPIESLDSPML